MSLLCSSVFSFSTVATGPETYLLLKEIDNLTAICLLVPWYIDLSANIQVAVAQLGVVGILYGSIIVRF